MWELDIQGQYIHRSRYHCVTLWWLVRGLTCVPCRFDTESGCRAWCKSAGRCMWKRWWGLEGQQRAMCTLKPRLLPRDCGWRPSTWSSKPGWLPAESPWYAELSSRLQLPAEEEAKGWHAFCISINFRFRFNSTIMTPSESRQMAILSQ